MRNTDRLTSRSFVLTAVVGSLLILALVSANTLHNTKEAGTATNEAVSAVSAFYLEAMADRLSRSVSGLIDDNFDQMYKAVAFIENQDVASVGELREAIETTQSLLGLNSLALVAEGDLVYTQYSTYTGGSRHPFLSELPEMGRHVSIVSTYGSSRQLCLAIPTPDLKLMGQPFKACFVQLDITDIVDLLTIDGQDRTYFALYSPGGANLSGTELGPLIQTDNLLDAISGVIDSEVWEQQRACFAETLPGTLTFAVSEAEETLCYEPVEGTDWEMAVLIRDTVIQDQITDINARILTTSRRQIGFSLVSVLTLAVVLLLQLRSLSRGKIEQERQTSRAFRDMANTDDLTGARSRHAYEEVTEEIDERLRAGKPCELVVVAADINGLKQVNDTQGHAAGDALIKAAYALICEHFDPNAVFRIGGDEFVIVLEGDTCATLGDRICALNRAVEANIALGEVVVAVGYARREPTDGCYHDVFERADQMMYQRKLDLKEMGAPAPRL